MKKKVLISLHDVTPFHISRIKKAELLFEQWGIKKINYLYIPAYHQLSLKKNHTIDSSFLKWIHSEKTISVQWLLHGYYHQTQTNAYKKKNWKLLKEKLLNPSKEGEFLNLSSTEVLKRVHKGKQNFKDLFGYFPTTFIAPAWMFNPHLLPILEKHQFHYTEDHSFIYRLIKFEKISVPVITWATRTWLKKITSQYGCPLLYRIFNSKSIIRLAVHPFDFDHPSTIRSIEKVISNVINKREQLFYTELENC